ncbi:MAG: coproporphyrinogen dehydrogenase HemZ [Tissierellia bacterium]|nr:coproporphyrinogen dehydrogenase HemZ [Tissierellia bacterium]
MISVVCNNQGLQHSVYEMIRLKFPQYENKGEIFICIQVEKEQVQYHIKIDTRKIQGTFNLPDKELNIHWWIKRIIYQQIQPFLLEDDGYGILTGIRPLKLYRSIFRSNRDPKKVLREQYFVSHEKIELMTSVFRRQEAMLQTLGQKSYNIYIHIPFCPSKCSYCSFDTLVTSHYDISSYVDDLYHEMTRISKWIQGKPHCIYIGGGTPSSIPIFYLEKIIEKALNLFGNPKEFTVECGRLDTLSNDLIKMLSDFSVDRISINPQTFNEKILKDMNRNFSLKELEKWMEICWNYGLQSINMDLILGLPGESRQSMINNIVQGISLKPQNITIHKLSIKKGSKLHQDKNINSKAVLSTQEVYDKMVENEYFPYYLYRQKRILGSGENLGYSKKDYESIYNIMVMEELEDVFGFGMGASSKIFYNNNKFFQHTNYRNMRDYHNSLDLIIDEKIKLIQTRGDSI